MNINDLYRITIDISNNSSSFIKLLFETEKSLHNISGVKYRPPGFYEVIDYSEIYALGDLHGDLDTFLEFLEKSNLLNRLESNSRLKIILLGDYVDRGVKQIELLTTIMYLKKSYPNNFILLRGNHEPMIFLLPYPHDIYQYLHLKYSGQADIIYSFIMKFFQKLAYGARVVGKLLFLHGGPPSAVLKYKSFEEAFSISKPCVDDNIIEEILWNDPIEHVKTPFTPSPRGAGVQFGEEVTEAAIKLARVKYIIRGHEAVNGYKINHSGRVVTLFDSRIESYGFDKAAYLHINIDDSLENITEYIYLI